MSKSKCNKIRHIVRIRQMLRTWRKNSTSQSQPSDVPSGHVAVCVGSNRRRFIVRASHLNHPVFRQLLNQAEEEYGFANNSGPLTIPCNEFLFQEIVQRVERGDSSILMRRCCYESVKSEGSDFYGESWPLIYAFTA